MVGERTRLMNQLHDHMLQIDPTYKEKSGPLTQPQGVDDGVTLQTPSDDQGLQTRLVIALRLAGQLHRLNEEIATITAEIRRRVQITRTPLLAPQRRGRDCGRASAGRHRLPEPRSLSGRPRCPLRDRTHCGLVG
jgi:hypothetical protein